MSSSEGSSTTDNAENLTWIPAIFLGDGKSVVGHVEAFSVVMLAINRVGKDGTLKVRAAEEKDTERLREMTLSEIYIRILLKG